MNSLCLCVKEYNFGFANFSIPIEKSLVAFPFHQKVSR